MNPNLRPVVAIKEASATIWFLEKARAHDRLLAQQPGVLRHSSSYALDFDMTQDRDRQTQMHW